MKNRSRTSNSIKNSSIAAVTQIVTMIMTFGMQTVFIKTLGATFLGLNGLFSNLLSILSFAELGIGSAITFSLYKPLARGSEKEVAARMNFFKKTYDTIGALILIIGLVLTPFLSIFVKDGQDVSHIHLYFVLFLLNTVVSYFFSYKRTLLIADQMGYLSTLNIFYFKIAQTIIQVIILIVLRNFVLYLLIQIAFTLASNIRISIICDRMFPYLKKYKKERISAETLNRIKIDTIGMVGAKIGGISVNNTNNLLISSFVGLVTVGVYSSYIMVIGGVTIIIRQAMDAITASIGNLIAENDNEKAEKVFNRHFFLNFSITYFSAILLFNLFNPFVTLWLGEKYVFPIYIVTMLVLNFYIEQMRMTPISFTYTYGLFIQNGKKSIVEAIVNLGVCLVFLMVFKLGVLGVLVGTTVVHLLVNIWYEPYLVYRKGFGKPLSFSYFLRYIFLALLTGSVSAIVYFLSHQILLRGVFSILVMNLIISIFISAIVYLVVFARSSDFKYFMSLGKRILEKHCNLER
ncbi:lipopolysaccharide biosynthesis protein [Sporolactobacillus terrae]|uniref:lipopolysaccharide biosynthesis protein n=1 Tax=Sporolactobacillus terrae TaxID=269673 RepID=UPI001CBCF13E|nr:hypothetical protein [Sporolactobacillus terrae]UAK16381.1 hypothetical protein K7399_15760 [Sporolactobacillus terrae]